MTYSSSISGVSSREGTRGVSPPPLPTQNPWEGYSYPHYFFKPIQELNPETCYQVIINSWLCYSLLGKAVALVMPRYLPLVEYFQNIFRLT